MERPAPLDIEYLEATADRQHRQPGPQRGGQQRTLAPVADGTDPDHFGGGRLTVGGRIDITSSGEDQTVEERDDLVGTEFRARRGGPERGKEKGSTAGRGD
jgi:hypothetical protein